jgi:ABC-type bacteriocin/lantibiotic exporter with double-glycine peptidase domain
VKQSVVNFNHQYRFIMQKLTPAARLWRLVASEKVDIRNVYILSIFQGLVNLSLPLGIQAIINLIQAGQLRTSWVVLVIFVLAGILFYGFLQLRMMRITESIEQRLFVNASFDFAYRIPRIQTESVRNKHVPELMNRFFEVMTIQKSVSKLLIDFSTAIVQIGFGLLLLSLYHPLFILLGISLVVVLVLFFRLTGSSGLASSLEESTQKFNVAFWLEEVARTLMSFKLSGNSDLPMEKTDKYASGYLSARKRHFSILMTQYRVLIVFKVIVAAALIIAGSILVVKGQINLGQFVAAEIIILLLINSVEKIILHMSTVYDLLTALEKVGTVTDLPIERDSGIKLFENNQKQGIHIRIKDLQFKFSDAPEPVLNNINLEVRSGEKICITGPNGAGKTTLLKVISGFYEDYKGSIVINDVPLENVHLADMRSHIGENFTEQEIFKGSVMENIICGRPGISPQAAIETANKVFLGKFIESLPDGYDTILEPEGRKLSSGIIRKIILARCLADKPYLILMEDNMSMLPVEERTSILRDILAEKNHATVILISTDPQIHQLCTRVISI